jgi:hypothetical protein
LNGKKQGKNDTKINYFRQLTKFTFYEAIIFDGLVKSLKMPFFVIPAEAGIKLFQDVLDPGFRRGDVSIDFLRDHQG